MIFRPIIFAAFGIVSIVFPLEANEEIETWLLRDNQNNLLDLQNRAWSEQHKLGGSSETLAVAICDPAPLPLEPIGPSETFETSYFDDEFFLTAWRFPCDQEFSWVVFTIEPKTSSDRPFVCGPQITILQDGVEDDTLKLCSDPIDDFCNSKCGDVFTKSSYAYVQRSISSDKIDLQKQFLIDWDLGNNFLQYTLPAYNPSDYDLGNPPDLDNQLAVNGLFYDPNNPGHGFDFNLHEAGFTVFYYGHTEDGERLWLISELHTEDIQYNVPIELEMNEVTTGVFSNPVQPETLWGTLEITMVDCDSGTASFNGIDGSFNMNFVRLVGLEATECN